MLRPGAALLTRVLDDPAGEELGFVHRRSEPGRTRRTDLDAVHDQRGVEPDDSEHGQARRRDHGERRGPPTHSLTFLDHEHSADDPPDPAEVQADARCGRHDVCAGAVAECLVCPTYRPGRLVRESQQPVRDEPPQRDPHDDDEDNAGKDADESSENAKNNEPGARPPGPRNWREYHRQHEEREEQGCDAKTQKDAGDDREPPRLTDATGAGVPLHQSHRRDQRHADGREPSSDSTAPVAFQPGHTLGLGLIVVDPLGRPKHHLIHVDVPAAGDAIELLRVDVTLRARAVVRLIAVRAAESNAVGNELVLARQARRAALGATTLPRVPQQVVARPATHPTSTRQLRP